MNMKKYLINIWNDNVGGSLIAALIIALGGLLVALIKSLFSDISIKSVIANFFTYLYSLSDNKIILIIAIIIILLLLIFFIRVLMKKVTPIIENLDNKAIPEINEHSTVFFSRRLSNAFPGDRGIVWYKSKEALKRLSILLKEPLIFKPTSNEASMHPIWWFRDNSSFYINEYSVLSKTKALITIMEMEIDRIAVVVDRAYYKSFVYVECKGEKQTGVYNFTKADFTKYKNDFGYCWEEFALFKGKPITREEYDDNSAVINGKVTSTSGSELRIRYLTKYNFIITSQQSPFNSRKFEEHSELYLDGILKGTKSTEDFFNFMKTFKKREDY
jgi:hypothetical protein